MQQLRVTAAVDQDAAPPFYTALSDAPGVAETRVLEWNQTPDDGETVLFAVRGDPAAFLAATETPAVESVALSGRDRRWTYALAELRPRTAALFDALRVARARRGLVVRKPIVYRDGDMHVRVVGEPEPLQAALSAAPAAMDVRVEAVGSLRGAPGRPTASLTDRQRDALAVAWALGYYEQPREATQADVAAELDCAPVTAGEHLRKAEAKLVEAAVEGVGGVVEGDRPDR
jgi:predicted DNA binding protein